MPDKSPAHRLGSSQRLQTSQRLRNAFRQEVRAYFTLRHYEEVETPHLVIMPGTETHLESFASEWQDQSGLAKTRLHLRTSPELHMKRLLCAGMPRVFQFATSFRNGGELSDWHHPEFCMLEWYETDLDLDGLMTRTEKLVRHLGQSWLASARSILGAQTSHTDPRWLHHTPERLSLFDLFRESLGFELFDLDPDLARKCLASSTAGAKLTHASLKPSDDFATAFHKILLDCIEPSLRHFGLCCLYDYPASQAALAKTISGRAQRFEMWIDGIEVCNGFDELQDAPEHRRRFAASMQEKKDLDLPTWSLDEEFLADISSLPQCSGNALGCERLMALLLGHSSIDLVTPFRPSTAFPASATLHARPLAQETEET